jgi:hypothetical protein
MDIEYSNLFHSKALQTLIQIGTFDLKIYHLATLAVDILDVDTLRGGQFGRRKKSRGQFLTSPLAPLVKFVP